MTTDLRPLIARTETNGISLAEAYRDRIYEWLDAARQAQAVDVLLVKSPPYSPRVAVAVEAWLPLGAPTMTRRARADIEIVPRDFCRWPVEVEIVIDEAARPRIHLGIVDFTQEHAVALLDYLLGRSPRLDFDFKRCRVGPERRGRAEPSFARSKLGAAERLQLAFVAPFQFWLPKNRPQGMKPDVMGALPLLLIAMIGAFWLSTLAERNMGNYFVWRGLLAAVVVSVAILLLDIDVPRAWQFLSGGRAALPAGQGGTYTAAADPYGRRESQGVVVLGVVFLVALVLPRQMAVPIFFILLVVATVLNARRRRLVWTSGRPRADPRLLLPMDSWQVLLIGLGSERDAVHDEVMRELAANADSGWSVTDERIWYWGADGKEERQQTVVTFRSALAFVQFTAYGHDLYVAWDAHVNRGVWVEKPVGLGTVAESGALCEVRSIAPGTRKVTEYDVSDGNCVIERVHAVVTRVVRRKMAEHRLDQEIDFAIVRERRSDLTREDRDKERSGPRLSLAGFRRQA